MIGQRSVVGALVGGVIGCVVGVLSGCLERTDPPAPGAPPADDVLDELSQAMLIAHNAARARVDPPARPALAPLRWDEGLAETAQTWANGCVFAHTPNTPYGENLAVFSPQPLHPELATTTVELWEGEVVDYDLASNRCAPGAQCGHYTQVVWRDTERVGCGISTCDDVQGFGPGILFVCSYDPPGNFVGQRPY
jgi:pathogenesis-related protein 1